MLTIRRFTMRTQRGFGNPFNNRGQFRPGRGFQGWAGRGFQGWGWKETVPDTTLENTPANEATEPSVMRYVGPCRCGRGPHAFYRNAKGNLVHVSEIRKNEQ